MDDIPELSNEQWTELVERLALYADAKLRKLTWRGVAYSKGGQVLGAASGADLAAEAIESLLDGSRSWNERGDGNFTDLLKFLMDVVDSKVSHLVECAENRRTQRMDSEDRKRELAYNVRDRVKTPDTIVADAERRAKVRQSVMAELNGDEMAASLFDCYEADLTKPQEIAELLEVDVQVVNNAKKRLARAADKAFQKLGRTK